MVAVVSVPSARADYEAGRRAWDEGHPGAALTKWRSTAASADRQAMLALGRNLHNSPLQRSHWPGNALGS